MIETIQDVESEEIEDFYRLLRKRAEECLAGWAEELGCDLIILRSHRIDPESPMGGIGTISHQVAVLASCSVMLMK